MSEPLYSPDQLVGAVQDRVHKAAGSARRARSRRVVEVCAECGCTPADQCAECLSIAAAVVYPSVNGVRRCLSCDFDRKERNRAMGGGR